MLDRLISLVGALDIKIVYSLVVILVILTILAIVKKAIKLAFIAVIVTVGFSLTASIGNTTNVDRIIDSGSEVCTVEIVNIHG